jgi:ribosome recycling factor
MNTIPDILADARDGMEKAVANTKRELAGIRTGKATPQLLDVIRVDAYGQRMSLTQIATVAAPEPKLLTIQPWDKNLSKAIEKAILESDLGITPSSDGTLIRLPIPPLTEERRREFVRIVHKLAEEGRVAIRHARHEAIAALKKLEHVSDDEKKRGEKDAQRITDEHVTQVDELVKTKEEDLLEV